MTGSSRSSEKEAFWRLAVEEHRASGLSVRAFCKRESLAEPSFYSWRKKLERRDGERSVTCRSPSTASQAMVPVKAKSRWVALLLAFAWTDGQKLDGTDTP